MWYVYILYDPRNNKPFYVGKGTKRRLTATMNINQTGNGLKRKFLQEIKASKLTPILKIEAEYNTEAEALCKEEELIHEFGRIIKGDGCLTNYSDGGDTSNIGWIPSESTRNIWSAQRTGVKQSPEHIAARVNKTRGKTRSESQKRNYVMASIRRTNPDIKANIVTELEKTTIERGTFSALAKKFNCSIDLISRIHKDIELYKEALDGWIKK